MLKSKIDSVYLKHSCERICQGDILSDFKFSIVVDKNKDSDDSDQEEVSIKNISFDYVIIISQDCDLQNSESVKDKDGGRTQFLPNLLLLPAFPSEDVKDGIHFNGIYNVKLAKIDSDIWKRITRNHDDRYHFLPASSEYQISNLVIDFKNYYTIPFDYILKVYHETYLATINELFRERLSQRFSNYLNRIPLPDLKKSETDLEKSKQ